MHPRHLILAFIAVITPPGFGCQAGDLTYDDFFFALAEVESGHNDAAVGDGGNAIGRYQVWRVYWIDATEFSEIGGQYEDVKKKSYAERVIRAYMQRYAREAWAAKDWETLARIHNGGPRGHKKRTTEKYWAKVKKVLDRLRRIGTIAHERKKPMLDWPPNTPSPDAGLIYRTCIERYGDSVRGRSMASTVTSIYIREVIKPAFTPGQTWQMSAELCGVPSDQLKQSYQRYGQSRWARHLALGLMNSLIVKMDRRDIILVQGGAAQ